MSDILTQGIASYFVEIIGTGYYTSTGHNMRFLKPIKNCK